MLWWEFDQTLYPHLDVFKVLSREGGEENLQAGRVIFLVEHSRSEIQLEDHDVVADNGSTMP